MTKDEKLSKLLDLITFDENDNLYFDGKIIASDVYHSGTHTWVNADNENLVYDVNK